MMKHAWIEQREALREEWVAGFGSERPMWKNEEYFAMNEAIVEALVQIVREQEKLDAAV